MIFNVRNYGAAGDGSHNDTQAIQTAIDDCHARGGGKVLLEGGHVYRSGALVLRSHVELHLEMGAVLKASSQLEDFDLFKSGFRPPAKSSVPSYTNCEYAGGPVLYFLYAKDCEYISITGDGTIDGTEEIYHGTVTPWHIDGSFYPRMPLIFLEHTEHLTLRQVTLTKSAFWTVHMVGCNDVLIDGIRILNSLNMANCDGIDPDHCQNVRIANCHIQCADDCIVFKNTLHAMQYGPCENISVSNCTLISTSAAIKFGTESEAPFRNITIQNCNISRSNRGISLQLRDKGCIENVTFSGLNIDTRLFSPDHWWGKAEPIAITALKRKEDTALGHIHNITFENINCAGENGILIYGDEASDIRDIRFRNVTLRLTEKTSWPKGVMDLRPCIDEGIRQDSLHMVSAHNAHNITMEDFRYCADPEMEALMGDAFHITDCEGFVI